MAVALAFALSLPGCQYPEAVERAHEQGAQAGREEGFQAGEAGGFSKEKRAARNEAYRRILDQLYSSGDYRMIPLFVEEAAVGFFLLGFGIQWILLYMLRRVSGLPDIDWVVLPRNITDVHLTLSSEGGGETHISNHSSFVIIGILSLGMLSFAGCKSDVQEAWEKAHEAGYKAGYHEGWQKGAIRGKLEGEQQGVAEARNDAREGLAWQLYWIPAILSLVIGMLVGLSTQYIILLRCRFSSRLAQLPTVVFVPGIRRSLAYLIFERNRQCVIWLQEEVAKLAAERRIKFTQMQTVHDIMVRRLATISSIEGFSQGRLLEVAKKELAAIVSTSQRHADASPAATRESSAPYTHLCPNCGKRIRYRERNIGTTVICPYTDCRKPFAIASSGSSADASCPPSNK